MNKIKISIFLLILIFFSNISSQDIFVGISAYGREQIDIAILPIFSSSNLEKMSEEVRTIVKMDLTYSLYFSLLEDSEIPEFTDVFTLNWDKLTSIGAEAIISCKLSSEGNTVVLTAVIIDPYAETVVFTKTYTGTVDKLRQIAHELSDDVVKELTGEVGIFTSKIVYIRKGGFTSSVWSCDYDGYGDHAEVSNSSLNLAPFWGEGGTIFYTTYKNGKPDLVRQTSDGYTEISSDGNLSLGGEVSPDGQYIVYMKNIDGNTDIYKKSLSSNEETRLTFSGAIDCSPTWSPSGAQIAFNSDRSGSPQIYIINDDGSGLRLLTRNGSYNSSPHWSPRGDRIVFVGRYEGLFQIFTISPSGEKLRQLTAVGENEDPGFSPDGLHIVFSSSRTGTYKLYSMNFNGTSIREVIASPGSIMPSWSH